MANIYCKIAAITTGLLVTLAGVGCLLMGFFPKLAIIILASMLVVGAGALLFGACRQNYFFGKQNQFMNYKQIQAIAAQPNYSSEPAAQLQIDGTPHLLGCCGPR